MQTIIFSGRLTSDCILARSSQGNDILKFTVAVNETWSDKQETTTFYDCMMKDSPVRDHLKKGRFVTIIGSFGVTQSEKDGVTYTHLNVWAYKLDLGSIPRSKPKESAEPVV